MPGMHLDRSAKKKSRERKIEAAEAVGMSRQT
jgi:hypothetical protein